MSERARGDLNFNRRAGTYAENASVQRASAAWLGEWIERDLPADARLWELGAGTGFFTREILARGHRVLATDIAPEMVVRGRHACPEADWAIHDSWKLPAGVADRLYSSSLLQWMPEPEKTLRVFREALRAGGKMLHGFFVEPSLQEFCSLVEPGVLPLVWRSTERWLELFRAAGFRVLRAEWRDERGVYRDAEDFLRKLRDSGATASEARVPAGALRRILREYERRFRDDATGGVFATWRFFRIELAL